MKVKTDYVPDECKWYLTAGKVYSVVGEALPEDTYWIIDDKGHKDAIKITGCLHLDGRAWEVVEE